MKIDLIELLKTRTVIHPTIVTSGELRDGNLHLYLAGYSWWRDAPMENGPAYKFFFQGVTGEIAPILSETGPDGWDEALDNFSVQSLVDANWAQPQVYDLYCSQPLKDVLGLYVLLENYLRGVDSYFSPQQFLNCGGWEKGPLASFADIGSSNSFLLARAPRAIADLLHEELTRQGVKHNTLYKDCNPETPSLRVRVGGSDFLCQSAVAILPD